MSTFILPRSMTRALVMVVPRFPAAPARWSGIGHHKNHDRQLTTSCGPRVFSYPEPHYLACLWRFDRSLSTAAVEPSGSCCWKCGHPTTKGEFFCTASGCGVILPCTSETGTFFSVLSMNVAFDLDLAQLERNFKNMQVHLHPDKFATKSSYERELATEHSSLVNQAYVALRSPLSRAEYLLKIIFNVDMQAKEGMDMGSAFYEEIFDMQELVSDTQDLPGLEKILHQVDSALAAFETTANDVFSADPLDSAAVQEATSAVTKYRYHWRTREEVAAKMLAVGVE